MIIRRLAAMFGRLHREDRATGATELLLVLATVVLPLALLTKVWFDMIRGYSLRLIDGLVLPFP